MAYLICQGQGHIYRVNGGDPPWLCPACKSEMRRVDDIDGRRYVLERSLSGMRAIIARAMALDPERTRSDLVVADKSNLAMELKIALDAVPSLHAPTFTMGDVGGGT